jgi:hypothetical protein
MFRQADPAVYQQQILHLPAYRIDLPFERLPFSMEEGDVRTESVGVPAQSIDPANRCGKTRL